MFVQWMLGGFVLMASWADVWKPSGVTIWLLPFLPLSMFTGVLWLAAAQVFRRRTAEQALKHSQARERQLIGEVRRLSDSLEQRVRERTAQLEAANKELEAFAYSVSHDLHAPLRTVDGFAAILAEDHAQQLDDEGQRVLSVIRSEAQRMGRLIDDLLDFSRLGRREMSAVDTDMTSLVREVFEQLGEQAADRELDFQLTALPMARADAALLRQVWFNLLDNALKYTRHRPRVKIKVGGSKRGSEIVYSVEDNGAGFDMRNAGRLFGVFQRLHRAEEFEGTGVGLALVQRIIRRHGGRVWAEAQVERGASFYFTLPSTGEDRPLSPKSQETGAETMTAKVGLAVPSSWAECASSCGPFLAAGCG